MEQAVVSHSAPAAPLTRQEAVVKVLQAPGKLFRLLRTLYKNGAFELVTPFEHKEAKYALRTLIQADADILHFVPDVIPHQQDKAFKKLLLEKSAEHAEKVSGLFDEFERSRLFWMGVFDAVLVLFNVAAVGYTASQQSYESIVYAALTAAVSLFYRLVGRDWTVKSVMKLLFVLLKRLL